MNLHRCFAALLLAACFLGLTDVAQAQIFGWRRGYAYGPPPVTYYAAPGNGWYPYYVAPLPAYGILPPPLATYNMLYGVGQTGDNYSNARTQRDYVPRQRASPNPAIPFEKSEVRVSDLRRVRYEITVPFANATVLIDGVKTKQTGFNRVYITPPLEEDKDYTTTFVVQWTDDAKVVRTRQRTFTVVAGETIRHTFIE